MRRSAFGWLAATTAAGVLASGCVVTVEPIVPPPATTITIRIFNETAFPLDPQLHIAAVDVGADNLFQGQYKRTNFGVGGLGTVLPYDRVEFTVACGQLGLLGTAGGIFGSDLTNPIDQGQQVVLQEGVSVNCGYVVEFRFAQRGLELINTYSVTLSGS